MKILLVQPSYSKKHPIGRLSEVALLPPLNLQLIASSVPEDNVRILDQRLDSDLEKAVKSFDPDIVGVTAFTFEFYKACEVLKLAKEINPRIFTVAGGIHATVMPNDYDKEYVDAVVIGEGEVTFKELVNALRREENLEGINGIAYRSNGHLKSNPPRELITDLDSIPFARRTLTQEYENDYHFLWFPTATLMFASRGCPYRCKFCSVWKFNQGKCRYRSPRRIVDELESIKADLVVIADDSFLHRPAWVRELLDLIDKRGIAKKYFIQARPDNVVKHPDLIERMAELGLSICLIGFETLNQKRLNGYNKRTNIDQNLEAIRICRDNDVMIYGGFIADPDFNEEDFDELIEFINKHNIITISKISVLTPFPGTDLYEEMFDELTTNDYELYDLAHAVYPTRLPIEEFYKNVARVYKSVITPRRVMAYLAQMHKSSFSESFNLFDGYPSLSEMISQHIGRHRTHVLSSIRLYNLISQVCDYREYLR